MTKENKKPEMELIYDGSYKEHPISDAFGGFMADGSFHITLCLTSPASDSTLEDPRLIKVAKVKLVMSPMGLRQLSNFLIEESAKVVVGKQQGTLDEKKGYI
jgi:hypothetical protein